jgi:DNA modification methylase
MIQRGLEFGDAPDCEILAGDCREVMAAMDAESVDSIVSDPPYGLSAAKNSGKSSRGGFMGKEWDHGVPGVEFWTEALRVAKPGAHLLAFGGTRTYHRLACAIEDAGWEIRDCVMWVYGSGFPKSLDVSKAIDKAAGAEREVVGPKVFGGGHLASKVRQKKPGTQHDGWERPWQNDQEHIDRINSITAPATDAAKQWSGFGTSLKPSYEPVIVARKKLIGTVAQNVLTHGTGGLNIDGCRVPHGGDVDMTEVQRQQAEGTGNAIGKGFVGSILGKEVPMYKPGGRWPANLIHDGSDEVVGLFPQAKGASSNSATGKSIWNSGSGGVPLRPGYGDTGSAARFFYMAKCSKKDRNEGLEGVVNHHPCLKPTALMRYLCRLVTPPGGIVLDPFMGSGSTGKAAILEGFRFIGIEREAEYVEIARARIGAVLS